MFGNVDQGPPLNAALALLLWVKLNLMWQHQFWTVLGHFALLLLFLLPALPPLLALHLIFETGGEEVWIQRRTSLLPELPFKASNPVCLSLEVERMLLVMPIISIWRCEGAGNSQLLHPSSPVPRPSFGQAPCVAPCPSLSCSIQSEEFLHQTVECQRGNDNDDTGNAHISEQFRIQCRISEIELSCGCR
jgi:hypothetical protein